MATVPCPAITSGSSKGCTKVSFSDFLQFQRMRVGVIIRIAEAGRLHRPAAFDRIDLDARRRGRHHNDRPAADLGRRQCNALGVVASRSADDAAFQLFGRETGDLVISAAQFEGETPAA
jgi:hypothetical protein